MVSYGYVYGFLWLYTCADCVFGKPITADSLSIRSTRIHETCCLPDDSPQTTWSTAHRRPLVFRMFCTKHLFICHRYSTGFDRQLFFLKFRHRNYKGFLLTQAIPIGIQGFRTLFVNLCTSQTTCGFTFIKHLCSIFSHLPSLLFSFAGFFGWTIHKTFRKCCKNCRAEEISKLFLHAHWYT